jgi:hypothetical protein
MPVLGAPVGGEVGAAVGAAVGGQDTSEEEILGTGQHAVRPQPLRSLQFLRLTCSP